MSGPTTEYARLAVFIDGWSMQRMVHALRMRMDFLKFRGVFEREGFVFRTSYYAAESGEGEDSAPRRLLDWLAYNGFAVHEGRAKRVPRPDGWTPRRSTALDLAIDAYLLSGMADHIVLCSDNGDLCPLVRAIQRRGVLVTAVATARTTPPMIPRALRRQVDHFIDLADLMPEIHRGPFVAVS